MKSKDQLDQLETQDDLSRSEKEISGDLEKQNLTGLHWTGLDWTGLDWTGLDWTGLSKWMDCLRSWTGNVYSPSTWTVQPNLTQTKARRKNVGSEKKLHQKMRRLQAFSSYYYYFSLPLLSGKKDTPPRRDLAKNPKKKKKKPGDGASFGAIFSSTSQTKARRKNVGSEKELPKDPLKDPLNFFSDPTFFRRALV